MIELNPRSESRQRTKLVGVRFTEEEYEQVSEKAISVNRNVASYLRNAALQKKEKTPKIERESGLALAKQHQSVGVNINQLTKIANATGNIQAEKELQALREVLNDIWQSLN